MPDDDLKGYMTEPTDLELEIVQLQAAMFLKIETKCDVFKEWRRISDEIDWTQYGSDEFGEFILEHYSDEFVELSYRFVIAIKCTDESCVICYDI